MFLDWIFGLSLHSYGWVPRADLVEPLLDKSKPVVLSEEDIEEVEEKEAERDQYIEEFRIMMGID